MEGDDLIEDLNVRIEALANQWAPEKGVTVAIRHAEGGIATFLTLFAELQEASQQMEDYSASRRQMIIESYFLLEVTAKMLKGTMIACEVAGVSVAGRKELAETVRLLGLS